MIKSEVVKAEGYTVMVLAKTATGEKLKLCQIEIPREGDSTYKSNSPSFNTIAGILDLSKTVMKDAEKEYKARLRDAEKAGPQPGAVQPDDESGV